MPAVGALQGSRQNTKHVSKLIGDATLFISEFANLQEGHLVLLRAVLASIEFPAESSNFNNSVIK